MRLAGTVNGLVLRMPFILLFAGSTWLAFMVGRRLFGPWQGFWAAVLFNLAPVFALSTGIFLQPEGPLMFFWLATIYCLAPLLLGPVRRDANRQWIAAGAMLGLAMLSKYSALFIALGAGLFLLSDRDRRRWLMQPGPWLAIAAALICFIPVLAWNANHGWISLLWQGQSRRQLSRAAFRLADAQPDRPDDRVAPLALVAADHRTVSSDSRNNGRASRPANTGVHRFAANPGILRGVGLRPDRRPFPLGYAGIPDPPHRAGCDGASVAESWWNRRPGSPLRRVPRRPSDSCSS